MNQLASSQPALQYPLTLRNITRTRTLDLTQQPALSVRCMTTGPAAPRPSLYLIGGHRCRCLTSWAEGRPGGESQDFHGSS